MINARSLGLAGGVVWGVAMFLMTLLALHFGYGSKFVYLFKDIYPAYDMSYLGAVIGLAYGFVDAFIGFYLIAWLYNRFNN